MIQEDEADEKQYICCYLWPGMTVAVDNYYCLLHINLQIGGAGIPR